MKCKINVCVIFAVGKVHSKSDLMLNSKEPMKLVFYRFFKGLAIAAALLLTSTNSTFAVELDSTLISVAKGEELFNAKCATCHSACDGEVVTGPSLYDVQSRWEGKRELLYSWITNPKGTYDRGGDAYVKDLYEEWVPKAGVMTAQAVSNEEIESILLYMETANCTDTGTGGGDCPEPIEEEEEGFAWGFWMLILAAILIILFASAGVKRQLAELKAKKEGREIEEDTTYFNLLRGWMWDHKIFTSLCILVLIGGGVVDGWYTLKDIGVYGGFDDRAENYKPEQPIDFSHRIHAGCNEISCVYCHSSAERGKHAGIPSTNVCMNCHKYIKEGKRENSVDEIAKIYTAIKFDKEAGVYVDSIEQLSAEARLLYDEENFGKPVKWVKVHNLPDHVYFNHSQHYTVAGIDCQTCHGPVETMDVVEQFSALTMGWCINCHNETAVQYENNGYYQDMHERLSKDQLRKYLEDEKITAREMGGWECAKCHY